MDSDKNTSNSQEEILYLEEPEVVKEDSILDNKLKTSQEKIVGVIDFREQERDNKIIQELKEGKLKPEDLKIITPDIAKFLVDKIIEESQDLESYSGGILDLSGLESLSEDIAKILTRTERDAHAWSHSVRNIKLNGLKKIELETAKTLGCWEGILHLNGLEEMPQDVAEAFSPAFSPRKGASISCLHLNGLKNIDKNIAEALQRRGKSLSLNGLKTISEEVAKILVEEKEGRRHKENNNIALNGLEIINESVAQALSKKGDGSLILTGLKADLPISVKKALVENEYALLISEEMCDESMEGKAHAWSLDEVSIDEDTLNWEI